MVVDEAFDVSDEDLESQETRFIWEALAAGATPVDCLLKVEGELREVEVESVRDYVQQSSQVADLHAQMQRCDGILAKMQEMLLGFEFDLGSASNELRHLQSESRRMSVKLRNRRATEARLGAFLGRAALAPDVASAVCDGAVDERFLAAVASLDSALRFSRSGAAAASSSSAAPLVGGDEKEAPVVVAPPREARACVEGAPLLEKLEQKAAVRCRDYLLEKIEALRTTQTNVHVLQRTQLAKYSYLFRFLEGHAADYAAEVKGCYVESMGKTLFALFKAYHAALEKHDLEVANRFDVVAVEEHSLRHVFTSRVSLTKRGDGFSLGGRDGVLRRLDAPPILVHVAIAEKAQYPFEELFRSSLRHLADAASSELQFVSAFLYGGPPGDDARRPAATATAARGTNGDGAGISLGEADDARVQQTVGEIFAKALSATVEHLENKLFACHDVVGLLLVFRLVRAARLQARKRPETRVAVLESFFTNCERLLRPRLLAILQANLESVTKADPLRLGAVSARPDPGQEKGAKIPTSKAPISVVFHSFWLIFGRVSISRNGLERERFSLGRARAEHPR